MLRRRVITAIVGLVAVLTLSLGLAAPASAATAAPAGGSSSSPSSGMGVCPTSVNNVNNMLAINRWSDGTSRIHDRNGDVTSAINTPSRMLEQMTFSFGTMMWQVTESVSQQASHFCLLDKFGGQIDYWFYILSNAVVNSLTLTMLMFVLISTWFWRVFRASGGATRLVFQKALVMAIMVIMSIGASRSTGGGYGNTGQVSANPTPYTPGTFSPGWFATVTDSTTNRLVGSITTALGTQGVGNVEAQKNGFKEAAPSLPQYDPSSAFSCESEVKAMHAAYQAAYKSDPGGAAMPMAVDELWLSAGLNSYRISEFGSGNNYGAMVFCRYLDAVTHQVGGTASTPYSTRWLAAKAGMPAKWNADNSEWWDASSEDNNNLDAYIVAMAACGASPGVPGLNPGNTYSDGTTDKLPDAMLINWNSNKGGAGGSGIGAGYGSGTTAPQSECSSIASGASSMTSHNATDMEDGTKGIDQQVSRTWLGPKPSSDQIRGAVAFVHAFHGNDFNFIAPVCYVIAALLVAAVMLFLSLAIIIAKVFELVMMLGILGTLLVSMFPSVGTERLASFMKRYIGVAFFIAAASLMVSIIVLFTQLLISAGSALFGTDSVLYLLWSGFSPLMAAICLNAFMKQAGIPSPLSPNGLVAYTRTAMGPEAGAMVGGGMGRVTSMGRKALNRGKDAAKGGFAKSNGKGPGGSGSGGGKNGMEPGGDAHKDFSESEAGVAAIEAVKKQRRTKFMEAALAPGSFGGHLGRKLHDGASAKIAAAKKTIAEQGMRRALGGAAMRGITGMTADERRHAGAIKTSAAAAKRLAAMGLGGVAGGGLGMVGVGAAMALHKKSKAVRDHLRENGIPTASNVAFQQQKEAERERLKEIETAKREDQDAKLEERRRRNEQSDSGSTPQTEPADVGGSDEVR